MPGNLGVGGEEMKSDKLILIGIILILSTIIIIGALIYNSMPKITCHVEDTIKSLTIPPSWTDSNGVAFYNEDKSSILCEDELFDDPFGVGIVENPTKETRYCLIITKKEICEIR